MSFLLFLAGAGVVLLIMIAVLSVVSVGEDKARARSLVAATGALDRQARKPGWRQVPEDEDVPAGRMGDRELVRHAAVASTRGGRTVRVAVFAASRVAGTYQGVPTRWAVTPGLVVAVDAPELAGVLRLNPVRGDRRYGVLGSLESLVEGDAGKEVFAQLASYQPPEVDVADGVACFTFTDVDLADRLDDVAGMACDVVEILANVRKPAQPVEE
ncbi:hypothetical protein [Lentzea sp. CA-135723]|uniref:hypothetical protein n=1 Tax=Lentzea sp. CA-135723 TaxID=3239950 RepID=UPI003D8DC926